MQNLKSIKNLKSNAADNYYWGVSDQVLAQNFINQAVVNGFSETINQPEYKVFSKYAKHDKRADFHFMIPMAKSSIIADLGSGYGNVTVPLATWHSDATVMAIDATLELLKFSQLRSVAEDCVNIEYNLTDSFDSNWSQQFNENYFDVFILNGILEWVPTKKSSHNPRLAQVNFLKSLRKMAKKNAILYLGIENRWYPPYFYNVRDPHSKLMYSGVLPRFLANLWCRLNNRSEGYINYIYGINAYKKLLLDSGWHVRKVMLPWLSYRENDCIVDIEDKKARAWIRKHILPSILPKSVYLMYKLLNYFGLETLFAHSFMFIATPDTNSHLPLSLAQEFLAKVADYKEYSILKLPSSSVINTCRFVALNNLGQPVYDISVPRDKNKSWVPAGSGEVVYKDDLLVIKKWIKYD